MDVTSLKDQGNKALAAGNTQEAISLYGQAIETDSSNHVLYSNRSAAYCKAEKYDLALDDAEEAIRLKPDWAKGYSRKAAALSLLGKPAFAAAAYEEAIRLDPGNQQLKDSLADVKAQLARSSRPPPPDSRVMNPFADPNLFTTLQMNPKTKQFLQDPAYVKIINELQSDPKALSKHIQDKRVMATLAALLGVNNLHMEDTDEDFDASEAMDVDPLPKRSSSDTKPSSATSKPTSTEPPKSDTQLQALSEKELGNAAYKKRDFETAIVHYNKAIEVDPSDITFVLNLAAVYLEKKDYELCIETCLKAVDVGRDNRADYKSIAKAYCRAGNACKLLKDWTRAKQFYEKSLSEHRTPQTREQLSHIEKCIKEEEKRAYIDPVKSEEEKQLGNKLFQEGNYVEALKHYTEAINRNPEDPKVYSNRAACYTKLAAFEQGIKDCDTCIKLDPSFIKGYLRKGKILVGIKQHDKAKQAYEKALELDPNCAEALDGYRECFTKADSDPDAVRKRAMADPEIQKILADPAMRLILEQMQSDPSALEEHLKNPQIAANIQKLMQSGLIAVRHS